MSDDRREMLEAALEQAEEGTLEAPIEKEIEVNDDPIQAESSSEESSEEGSQESADRDEKGRFKAKESDTEGDQGAELEPVAETLDDVEEKVEYTLQKPTTFKKEYVSTWEKLAAGKPLTKEESIKFAEYTGITRESEFKRGVSVYKGEADKARELTQAIGQFEPELQKHGIHPVAWINNLGRAHYALANGTYEQKLQAFNRLAQDYGINI